MAQKNGFDYAYSDPILQKVIDALTLRQFLRENKITAVHEYKEAVTLVNEELVQAAFLSSILASSPNEQHRQRAIAFATLLFLDSPNSKQYASYCYIIFSRTGNIQQGKLLPIIDKKADKFLVQFDGLLSLELSTQRSLSFLELPDLEPIYMSDFQKKLWEALEKKKPSISISGPTSSGKSFIIQSHLLELSRLKKGHFKALYIVPTRALISEVSSELRKKLSSQNVAVKIAAGDEELEREILVLTPERCLQLLRTDSVSQDIDFIFFDEVQKLEDGERGVLLEHVYRELHSFHKNSQFVVAGPYLMNLDKTLSKLGTTDSSPIESNLSPVYQLKSILRIPSSGKKIEVTIKTGIGTKIPSDISIDKSFNPGLSRQPEIIAQVVNLYAEGSNNIIYAPRRIAAESIALALAKLNKPNDELNKKTGIEQLVKYLAKEVHPDCSLIRCLRSGVAFHHGMIPEMAKIEIEELYKKGEAIRNLVCTTTLLEGVNLPADRIFIYQACKRDRTNPLSDFDFGNLTGRAGRANLKLNGSVYCIELGKEKWAEAKFDSNPTKEVVPVTTKVMLGNSSQVLFDNIEKNSKEMTTGEIDPAIIFTLVYLRQRAVANPEEVLTYIKNKDMPEEDASYVSSKVIQSVTSLDIPREIVKLNPTIDPILQNSLFKDMTKNIDNWLIDKKPKTRGGRENGDFKQLTFYYQFQEITKRLDYLFGIESLIRRKRKFRKWFRPPSFKSLTYYGVTWIEQKPLSHIISSEISKNETIVKKLKDIEEKRSGEDQKLKVIDRAILEVIDHINNNIRFELVKHFKIYTDIIDWLIKDENEKMNSILIPEMLELGAYKPTVLTMIRAGISRSAAIEAANCLEISDPHFEGDVIAWLIENVNILDPIYRKHLERIGLIRPVQGENDKN